METSKQSIRAIELCMIIFLMMSNKLLGKEEFLKKFFQFLMSIDYGPSFGDSISKCRVALLVLTAVNFLCENYSAVFETESTNVLCCELMKKVVVFYGGKHTHDIFS